MEELGRPTEDVATPERESHTTERSHSDRVARQAYRRYEERGRADGHDLDDWLEAEREVEGSDAD